MVVSPLSPSYARIAERIEAAFIAKKPYPIVSQEIEGLTADQAYEIQAGLTKLREKKAEVVIGYKAGLTAAQAQETFGVKEPAWGTLFESMLGKPETMYQTDFVSMFIETEIGFRFGQDITQPVQDIESLKSAVAVVFPALELPDVAYPNMEFLKATDLIVTNVGARKLLIGKEVSVKGRDLNAIEVRLLHDGQEVTSGIGKNALGDQWEALKWTVNNVLGRDGQIKDGYIFITGCTSDMVGAEPGKYLADYGDFDKIEFEYK